MQKPFVLLALLFAVLLFMVGFRYGRYVEKIDKTYVPVTPVAAIISPTQIPTPTTQFNLTNFTHVGCKLSFLHPNYLIEEKISSTESKLSGNSQTIFVSCDRQTVFAKKEAIVELEKTQVATISGQKIPLYEGAKQSKLFILTNPLLGRSVFFEAHTDLVTLIAKTLEFK